jgi:hypothetical protein
MAPDNEQDWIDAGLDGDDLFCHCTCSGWSLQDVLDVLATDGISANPLDWCYTGLDPLEVRAAIRGGVCVELLPQTAPNKQLHIGEPPTPTDRRRHKAGPS